MKQVREVGWKNSVNVCEDHSPWGQVWDVLGCRTLLRTCLWKATCREACPAVSGLFFLWPRVSPEVSGQGGRQFSQSALSQVFASIGERHFPPPRAVTVSGGYYLGSGNPAKPLSGVKADPRGRHQLPLTFSKNCFCKDIDNLGLP